ncbi:DNA-3-methyladenine glycosylase [Nonlabens tegetincola]|uniref:DNA-3-methyladenine glycosylase n=1 Tax=Nonlabens tegetincola TaxID=323273 RepID=UPI0021CF6E72|nr:DNA-3-methyladenine glycosylase [Nonlabens tegetincola]
MVALARYLIGTELVTEIDGLKTSGIITETEAYRATMIRLVMHIWVDSLKEPKLCMKQVALPMFTYVTVFITCSILLLIKNITPTPF